MGNPKGIYKQMPDDYLASEIAGFQKGLKGSRLVILRKMNLMHYIYMEKIDATKFIGFCLIFNKAYVARPKQLITLFKYLIEDYLLNKGDILRYSSQGELQYVIDSFSQNTERYRQLNLLINERFENQIALYGINELTTTFNGEHTMRIVSADVEENQMLQMAFSYNTLIIDDNVGMEQGYIPKIMADLKGQVNSLNREIGALTQQNEKLKRQKKQFKWVVVLLIVILIGIILFVVYAQNKTLIIEGQSDEIASLNDVIIDRNKEIIGLNLHMDTLRMDSIRLSTALNNKTRQLYTVQENLRVIHRALDEMPTYLYFPAWTSTNYHQPNSESATTYSFFADEGDVLNIPYFVSAEGCCDYLTISLKKGGKSTQLVHQCGVTSDTYRYTFNSSGAYQLMVSYQKDGSVDKNNDNAGVKSFYIYRKSLINLRDKVTTDD